MLLQNQYVSVSVAAPATSRQAPNTLIAASILSMTQPLSKRIIAQNQAAIPIMIVPNLSEAVPHFSETTCQP